MGCDRHLTELLHPLFLLLHHLTADNLIDSIQTILKWFVNNAVLRRFLPLSLQSTEWMERTERPSWGLDVAAAKSSTSLPISLLLKSTLAIIYLHLDKIKRSSCPSGNAVLSDLTQGNLSHTKTCSESVNQVFCVPPTWYIYQTKESWSCQQI